MMKKVPARTRLIVLVLSAIMASTSVIRVRATTNNVDVNGDGVVDILDFQEVKKYYNQKNSKYDLNNDGIVDIYDMNIVSKSIDASLEYNDYYSIGNSSGNLVNHSIVAYSQNWIYYRNTQDSNRLYKAMLNGDYKTKISDDSVVSLNVVGNTLYYINEKDNKIYSLKTDGSGRTLIVNEAAENLIATSQYIFYKSKTDKKVYRLNVNGKDKKDIILYPVDRFILVKGTIYYSNANDNNKFYRIDINGQNKEILTADSVLSFAYEKDFIYYVSKTDNCIYSFNTKTKAIAKVLDTKTEGGALTINVKDNVIYYSSKSDGQLYKVNIDGTNKKAIGTEKLPTNLEQAKLSVDAGWIYYINAKDENRLYAITTEGRGKKDMESIIVGIVDVSTTLSLRQGPSTSTAILAALPKNTKLEIIDRTSNNGSTWYKVIYRNGSKEQIGYVSAYYVIVVNDDRMWNHLGVLSEKYESNGDPGTISNTKGDLGGKSYGAWQFSTNQGSLTTFFYWLEGENKKLFDILNAGWVADGNKNGAKFDAAWKSLATNHYKEFYELQHAFAKMIYYDKAIATLNARYNKDFNTYSFAFRNAVWSTAVHHGVGGATNKTTASLPGVISVAIEQSNGDERDIIQRIYAQRSKLNIYFSGYDPKNPKQASILEGLKSRFINECEDALQMYDYALSAGE